MRSNRVALGHELGQLAFTDSEGIFDVLTQPFAKHRYSSGTIFRESHLYAEYAIQLTRH